MTERSFQIHSCDTAEESIEKAVQEFFNQLTEVHPDYPRTLVLLAGGSATKLYSKVSRLLMDKQLPPGSLNHLTLALGDERWPEINNTKEIEKTGFLQVCQELGAQFIKIPILNTSKDVSKVYESMLTPYLGDKNTYRLAVIGIGGDGHILGVNTDDQAQQFNSLFLGQNCFVSYISSASTAQFPQFPERITLTITGLNLIDSVICLVNGSEKKEILERLHHPITLSLSSFPAKSLLGKKVSIFTDQKLK